MCRIKAALFGRERGQALIAVLVLLVVGGIIIVPFLYLSSTTMKYVEVTEQQLKGLYAADAGIEYSYWQIVKSGTPYNSNLASQVNGMTVTVTTTGSDYPYTVTATAKKDTVTVITKSATVDNAGGTYLNL